MPMHGDEQHCEEPSEGSPGELLDCIRSDLEVAMSDEDHRWGDYTDDDLRVLDSIITALRDADPDFYYGR